jgi:hypothetical protein
LRTQQNKQTDVPIRRELPALLEKMSSSRARHP